MATGTTSAFVSTRNDILSAALKKVRMWPEDGNPPANVILDAIKSLNRIIRQEDLRGVQEDRHLWALSEDALFLTANGYIYGEDDGLPTGILDLYSVSYRNTGGDDTSVDIITAKEYSKLDPKNETGDPEKVYLKKDRLPSNNLLYVWPVKTSVTAPDEVIGSDSLNYKCILEHTSAAVNQPVTGASWQLYWKQEGSSGSAWATATEYTSGELLYLTFKRPLFDFTSPYQNPDMPQGWDNYLIYSLAVDLAPESTLSSEDKLWLTRALKKAKDELFPSSRANATTYHNKTNFF